MVNVIDDEKPTITAPGPVTVSTDSGIREATAVNLGTPETGDNCSVADVSNDAPTVFPIGETLVTWTVTDASGNTETATQLVNVIDDEKPTITAPGPITVSTDAGVCEANEVNLGTPEIGDNCEVASVTNDAPGVFPIGETLVTWTVTDASGNTETTTQLVTVLDTEAPLVLTQNLILELNAGESIAVLPSDVDNGSSDNCGIASITLSKSLLTETDEGENEVILTVMDNSGNSSIGTAIVTLIVIRDPQCLVIVNANNLTVNLDKNGQATINTRQVDSGSSSTCGRISSMSLSQSIFTCNDLGEVSVTLTGVDVNGNVGSSEFIVTVIDPIGPNISRTPKRISATLAEGESLQLPDYRILYPANDNCGVTEYIQNPVPGTIITTVDTYPITLTARDQAGNVSSATFDLNISSARTKGGGKGKNKFINPSDLVQVAWNTSFEELEEYSILYDLEEETVEIQVDWNEEDYDPLVPGIYEISGKVKQLNSGRKIPVNQLSMYVLVMDKTMPLDISLSNQKISKDLKSGQVVGVLQTEDPADNIHSYNLEPSADFELDGNQVRWIGEGELRNEYTISVTSIDRIGQAISKEITITRENGANEVTVFPNPAGQETNIKVDLIQANTVSIRLFDSAGRLVFEESEYHDRGFTRSLNLQTLSAGLYQVQVQIGFETITKRLVKVE